MCHICVQGFLVLPGGYNDTLSDVDPGPFIALDCTKI